jgi:hypothetical protein
MVINDVPKITDDVRNKLSIIFDNQFIEIENNISYLLTFPNADYAHEFDYHNLYQQGCNNLVRSYDGKPMMSVFNFNLRNTVKIFRLLQIENYKPILNGIRVFSNTIVPMHMDLNKGELGRELPILSISVSGDDGMVFMSNEKDGSRRVSVPGKSSFILYPTLMSHGAKSGNENYDLIQIQLTAMI